MKKGLCVVAVLLTILVFLSACTSEKPPENNVNEIDIDNSIQPVSDYVLETVAVKDSNGVTYDFAQAGNFPSSVRYGKAELSLGYKSLTTDAQREMYDEMLENVYYIAPEKENGMYDILEIIIWGEELTEAEIRQVIVAFSLDNPQVYWMDNKFGYSNTTGYTILQLYSYMSAEEVESSFEELAEKTREYHLGLTAEMSEYDRELYAHDWIVDNCNYADDVFKISDDYLSFTSYGAMVNSKAVCEGYTRALQLLLASAGIESYPIIGNGNEGLHMWNSVKIDGEWYYVDSTWDDTTKGSGYDYFNITTEQLLHDHTIMPVYSQLSAEQVCGVDDGVADSFNLTVPVCSGTAQNYFVRNAFVIEDFYAASRDGIKDELRAAHTSLAETITLCISADLDYDEALDSLFYSGEYIFFECLDAVNEEFSENYFDRNNVSIRKKANLNVVTVILQYTDEV